MDAPRSRPRRIADRAVVLAFLAALAAPTVDQLARPAAARDVIVEFRTPAKLPGPPRDLAQLLRFPDAFTRWFDDHYGLRDRFLFLNSYARWFGLGSSPSPKIVRGAGGWIFVEEGQALERHRGAQPMSDGLLEAWTRMLEERRDWLASLGIEYLLVASPSKLDVYPERLPARYVRVGPPRVRQLLDHLTARTDLPVLDLLPVTLGSKARDVEGDSAYYPLGDHWTDRAAHDAYEAIVARLGERFPKVRPLPREAFAVEASEQQGDSWAGRMYLGEELRQPNLEWRLVAPRARRSDGSLHGPRYVAGRRDGKGPRALLLHDSFTVPMRPWLAEHFARLDARWSDHLRPELVLEERPDVVIECFNEFTLLRATPQSTPEEDGGRRRTRFDAAGLVLWRMDPAAPAWRLRTTHDRRPRAEGTALRFEPQAPDELLELPALDYPQGADLLLRMELASDAGADVSLFYRTTFAPALDPTRRVTQHAAPGRAELVFELPSEPFTGKLAVQITGGARILALELRAAR